ncbi:MAG TPA: hypothetical protein PKC84_13550 [Paracoccaceae bacterium]|nr:hypothetical protein [Paracoccaceae bacterium]
MTGERVTRAEAARRLNIDRSTVTRLVKAHPALLDDAGHVCPDEIARQRDAVLNPALQTRLGPQAGRAGGAPAVAAATGPTLNDSRTRAETAKAEQAELDLAERLGLTLDRRQVEDCLASAGQMLGQRQEQDLRAHAERLARIDDTREMERALRALFDAQREAFAQALALAAAPAGSDTRAA